MEHYEVTAMDDITEFQPTRILQPGLSPKVLFIYLVLNACHSRNQNCKAYHMKQPNCAGGGIIFYYKNRSFCGDKLLQFSTRSESEVDCILTAIEWLWTTQCNSFL
ncbi:hypothetical protein MKW92_049454 [Papaver armeniacum]|nr:hypothetical protein MKW92_049454 [Papaver armeniacum]